MFSLLKRQSQEQGSKRQSGRISTSLPPQTLKAAIKYDFSGASQSPNEFIDRIRHIQTQSRGAFSIEPNYNTELPNARVLVATYRGSAMNQEDFLRHLEGCLQKVEGIECSRPTDLDSHFHFIIKPV